MSLVVSAFRFLVLPPGDRTPFTLSEARYFLFPAVLLVVLAGFARRPGTWVLRLALLPVALTAILRGVFGFAILDPDEEPVNHMFGVYGLQFAIKALDYGFSPTPFRKLSEIEQEDVPPRHSDGSGPARNGRIPHAGLSATDTSKKPPQSNLHSVGSFVFDGAELICSLRGVGWDYGTGSGLHVPRQWKNVHNRKVFILQTIMTLAFYTIVVDLLCTIVRLSPIGSPQGGSIFAFGSNTFEKYAISTGYTIISGLIISLGMDQFHHIFMLCGVTMFHSDPDLWPPFSDHPWFSTSLHELWGRRWHQLMRRSFFVTGGIPFAVLSRLCGFSPDVVTDAVAFGVCLMSGLLHSWDYYALASGKTPGLPTILFFAAQGVGLALEREWRRRTGKRVNGFVGWMWVLLWTVGAGQACIDSWYRLAFLGKSLIPGEYSPAQHIFIPWILRSWTMLLSTL